MDNSKHGKIWLLNTAFSLSDFLVNLGYRPLNKIMVSFKQIILFDSNNKY